MRTPKPKILFLLHTPPPIHGASLVGKFIKESDILNRSYVCRHINLGMSLNIGETGKFEAIKFWRYILIFLKIIKQVVLFKPDLCYFAITVKGFPFFKDALFALFIKLSGVKIVYHLHTKGISTRQNRFPDNFLYNMIFKNTDVILLSKYLYRDIQKYVPHDRVCYCPNGIPEILMDQKRSFGNSVDAGVKILFLSNLIASKGVYLILEACKILYDKRVSFHCTFVGGEGDITIENIIKRAKELGIAGYIDCKGSLYGNDKTKEFMKADIFAFPTYYHNETYGLVNLEAMQYSLPVISTYEGGIPDIIENGITGFLIPQKDASALAEKLELLICNPGLRVRMGKAGRKKYEKRYTLEIFEKRIEQILNLSLLPETVIHRQPELQPVKDVSQKRVTAGK